jgi:hypothetical protein
MAVLGCFFYKKDLSFLGINHLRSKQVGRGLYLPPKNVLW